jgi:glycosyltransferase involved in cell wall biosynthesis
VRSASPAVGVAALYCKRHRRAFVFSSSNVSDFTLEKMPGRLSRSLYGLGVRSARAVVIQSEDQRALALDRYPGLRRIVRIPSFAEPVAVEHEGPGDAFLWFSRCVEQKQPLRYVELARALPEARFVMVPVPEGRDGTLLQEVRRAGAELPNLDVLEPLPHAQLAERVARAVAVVNTSTLEGLPNAFLEAWSAGVPVLTLSFDPDGVVARERVGVAADGSWTAFVAGARDLWGTRHDRAELSRRVRDYVTAEHSPQAVGSLWGELLDGLRRERT